MGRAPAPARPDQLANPMGVATTDGNALLWPGAEILLDIGRIVAEAGTDFPLPSRTIERARAASSSRRRVRRSAE
jgi:hypothetical protein